MNRDYRIQLIDHSPAQPSVAAITNDPPETPTEGMRVIVGEEPTGVFVGHENEIAWYYLDQWQFDVPENGWSCVVTEVGSRHEYDGTKWEIVQISSEYTHPTGFENQPETELSGKQVISQIKVNNQGHVTGVIVREIGVGLEGNSTTVPYKTNTTLLDLSTIEEGKVASFYMCITALFGVKHDSPAKKVSMVATRISEFAIHEDASGTMRIAHVKTQHTGVYAKYGSEWTNPPTVIGVDPEDIKIMANGNNLIVYHKFDKGENITPTITCKYRIDLQTIKFE
jgi:hypothetical protein